MTEPKRQIDKKATVKRNLPGGNPSGIYSTHCRHLPFAVIYYNQLQVMRKALAVDQRAWVGAKSFVILKPAS